MQRLQQPALGGDGARGRPPLQDDVGQGQQRLEADRLGDVAKEFGAPHGADLLLQHLGPAHPVVVGGVVAERDIRLAEGQLAVHLAGDAFVDDEPRLRIALEGLLDQVHTDGFDDGVGHGDADLAHRLVGHVADVRLGGAQAAEQRLGVLIEAPAGRGRLHPAGQAGEQLHAQVRLQVGDVVADRGLGDVAVLGGVGKVLLFEHRAEVLQLSHVHRIGPPFCLPERI